MRASSGPLEAKAMGTRHLVFMLVLQVSTKSLGLRESNLTERAEVFLSHCDIGSVVLDGS